MTRPDLLARLHAPARAQPGAVYLLPHTTERRFKIGWSLRPLARVRMLPEFRGSLLDLPAAQVAWFVHAQRAQQVERVLHRGLAPYRAEPWHEGDGYSEWFNLRGIVLARRLIALLPADLGTNRRAQLVPLLDAPEQPVAPSIVMQPQSALDAWYRVEDLWMRLLAALPLAHETEREQRRLYWLGLRRLREPAAMVLRSHALNIETYEWREDGKRRSLVSLMDWDGDDLLLHLAPPRLLQRWVEGEVLDDLVRGFVARHAVPRETATAARRAPAPTA